LKAMKKPEGVIFDHAGDIHLALGDKDAALRSWKAALDAGGQDFEPEKVKAKIAELQGKQSPGAGAASK